MARRDSTRPSQRKQSRTLPEKYKRWLTKAMQKGLWFFMFRPMYRILPKLDALFLCDLMNVMEMSTVGRDGFFSCPSKRLESLDWTDNEQQKRFAALDAAGVIRTQRRGIPARRWVMIDMDQIVERWDAAYPESDNNDDTPPDDDAEAAEQVPTDGRDRGPQVTSDYGGRVLVPTVGRNLQQPSVGTTRNDLVNKEEGNAATAFGGSRTPPDSDLDSIQNTRRVRPTHAPSPEVIPNQPKPGQAAQSAPQRKPEGNPAPSAGGAPAQGQTPVVPPVPPDAPPRNADGIPVDDRGLPVMYLWEGMDPFDHPDVGRYGNHFTARWIPRPVAPVVRAPAPKPQATPATPPHAAPASPEDESGALFPSTATKTTRQDADRAARLRAHVVDMKWRPSGTRNDWGPEFGILRREREKAGDAPDRIDRVLDEYITKRINKPTIKSGKELRTNWDWVLRETGMDKPVAPEVTPAARKVADRVLARNWPFSDDAVRTLAQMSMTAIDSFWDKLDAFPKPINQNTGRPSGLFGALTGLLGELSFQTEKHLMDVAERLGSWQGGYRGGTDSLVWAPDKHQFGYDARDVCKSWQWPGEWPALLKAINDNWAAKEGK